MRVLISGSTGLVGTALGEALTSAGHTVSPLLRPGRTASPGSVRWDPAARDGFDAAAAEGAEAVVHLAGESIASGRWNDRRKAELRSSRVAATRNLVDGLGRMRRKPAVLVSASAIGYYGDRGDEELTEASAPGRDFLADLAVEWEAEAARAEEHGIRVVIVRFGIILSPRGGALQRMLLPFRMGVGGRLGSGKQWMSWVSLPEVVAIIGHVIENPAVRGPVNAVAPNPVRNSEFTQTLGRVLRRPTVFPAPAFALRLLLGEMADALLLSSQRVLPEQLATSGYRFRHEQLETALRDVLRRG
jgi:uncharacterized protein (TIGR01777 family)